jgi:hypothetical protein
MKRYYGLLQKNISIIQHHTEGRVGRRLTFRGILVRIRVLLECVPNSSMDSRNRWHHNTMPALNQAIENQISPRPDVFSII